MASNQPLLLDNLEIGQTLIAVEHLGFSRMIHPETPYRVTKKMKTRLVITLLKSVEGALVPTPVHLRVIVRDGVVTRRVEGWSDARNGIDLHTEDSPMLPEYRAEHALSQAYSSAHGALDLAKRNLTPRTAESVIKALQAFLDSNPSD